MATIPVSDPVPADPPPAAADTFAVEVYEFVLARGTVTGEEVGRALNVSRARVEEALGALRALRLVRAAEGGGSWSAVHPEAAQLELLVPLERALEEHRRRLSRTQGRLWTFMTAFDATRRGRPREETVVVSDDAEEIALRLARAAQRCTREILVMQPCVAQEHPELRQAHPLILEALQRGVRVRVLYPHTARGDAGTRSRVRELVAAGADVRTSRVVHGRSLVLDRDTAFVPAEDVAGGRSGVTAVYEPAVASFLGGLHDLVRESAVPLETGAAGYADARDDLRSTILEFLAAGVKDEVIARRIGLSERSFRRHVAAIMRDLAAGSRFQAGVRAAQVGLVTTPSAQSVQPAPSLGAPDVVSA
ncbi:LuxR family transcriptional regulator [Streptomyces triticagri]|uniref:LuxR family transcriptional regulator n=1 Tax=Streptomyces triticagri TaxID=2293568 RepID=A0A372LYL2_9ACTN|nr:LuxR C-terminal-related transcriptional regulator [Streptomyces triticagri]RFU83343.1 LuxR family transcriptional regulator [Streptomyces triticagri]